jgi:hypothetical protein
VQRRTLKPVVWFTTATCVLAVSGCARQSEVVGTYRSEPFSTESAPARHQDEVAQFVPAVYEFRSDGAVEISVNGQSVDGRWQIQDDQITVELPEGTAWVKPSPISFELEGGELVYDAPESDSLSTVDYRLIPVEGG